MARQHHLFLFLLLAATTASGQFRCPSDRVSFEMLTGYVYTGPSDVLDSQPGTLMLTDCIETCRQNSSCQSITYETGLCVLFSSNADGNDGKFALLYVYLPRDSPLSLSPLSFPL